MFPEQAVASSLEDSFESTSMLHCVFLNTSTTIAALCLGFKNGDSKIFTFLHYRNFIYNNFSHMNVTILHFL